MYRVYVIFAAIYHYCFILICIHTYGKELAVVVVDLLDLTFPPNQCAGLEEVATRRAGGGGGGGGGRLLGVGLEGAEVAGGERVPELAAKGDHGIEDRR